MTGFDNSRSVRFSQEDLELFRDASGDRNPLHLSREYASKTAYGQQVVFGALGAIACLGSVAVPSGERLARLTADFHRPMFLDVKYTLRNSEQGESKIVRLQDGSVPVLTLSLQYTADTDAVGSAGTSAHFDHAEARDLGWNDVAVGTQVQGQYAPDGTKTTELRGRWGVRGNALAVEALLWSSYVVGMEMPGKNALFFRVSLDFKTSGAGDAPVDYTLKVANANNVISQIKVAAELNVAGAPLASGQLVAFVRPEMPPLSFEEITSDGAQPLSGKVALVVGASRGLGASISACLAAQGAKVIALSRSKMEAVESMPGQIRDRISVEPANAADTVALEQLRERIQTRFGRLDFLVCSAFPSIPSLRLEENAFERIRSYLSRSTDLVLAPLCTFLPLLNESQGCAVILSSVAVEKPVRDWPHYIAAKNAVEGFALVAPMQFPETSCLIVRPDKLLTDMTNTPMGRQNAMSPLAFAARLCRSLQKPPAAGTSRVFHGNDDE